MKKNTEQMQPNTYYHVYNRGINGCRLFTKKGNTEYFLKKYEQYILPIADTFAYVLMGNHFHFAIKTKSETELRDFYCRYKAEQAKEKGIPFELKEIPPSHQIIGGQFSKVFNGYAQAFNKQEERTGGLFETPFRRIPVTTEAYSLQLVYYIHFNPQKHRFTTDFRTYSHSSYRYFLNDEPCFINKTAVLELFGGIQAFLDYHSSMRDLAEEWQKENWVEVD